MRIALLLLFVGMYSHCWCLENVEDTKPMVDVTNPPNVSVQGGELDCTNSGIQIFGNSTTPGVTYSWIGPNNFASDEQNPFITEPGGYILTVTAPDGCTASDVAVVTEDTSPPDVYAAGGFLPCSEDSLQLTGQADVPIVEWSWQGPNGFVSYEQNPFAYDAGPYILTVTAENGCTKAAQGNIILDGLIPEILVSGADTLNCSIDTVSLTGTIVANVESYEWIGPNGFSTSDLEATIIESGTYIFNAVSSDGCRVSESVEVFLDTIAPNVETANGLLTCNEPNLTLYSNTTSSNVTYDWQGPNNYASTDTFPTVSISGNYSLTITAENGCTSSAEAIILEDFVQPDLQIQGGFLDCNNAAVQLLGSSITDSIAYEWSGPNAFSSNIADPLITVPGQYFLTITAPNGCTNSDMVLVESDFEIPDASATGGVLDCIQTSLALSGDSQTPDVTYNWTGPNNFISDLQSPVVVDSGTYSLTVMAPNGCTGTIDAEVILDAELPDAMATGGVLDCDHPNLELFGNSNTPGATYEWNGPNAFSSNDPNPTIDIGGNYELIVTAQNGCTNSVMAVVTADFAEPTIQATGGMITCTNVEVMLLGSSTTNGVVYSWQGPNNFNAQISNPMVSQEGDYTLTITAPNGCTSEAIVNVTRDDDFPNVNATSGVLNCIETSIQLTGNSSTPNVTWFWEGPNNYSSDQQNPQISVAGSYTLTVTAPNGCSAQTSVLVDNDIAQPDVQTTGGELTCSVLTIQLSGNSSVGGSSYFWSGPSNFSSNEQNPIVSEAGNYSLIVTAPNGCTNTADVIVSLNNTPPQISALGGMLTCSNPEVQLFGNSSEPNSQYSWQGPNGFSSGLQNPMVSIPGVFELTVTGTNDCHSTAMIEVTEDVVFPIINFQNPQNLSCAVHEITIDASDSDSGVNFQFNWTTADGNFAAMENTLTPLVDEPGNYQLNIENQINGCITSQNIEVIYEETGLDDANLLIQEPTCWGDEDGGITVESVQGGMEPYIYSLNGGTFSSTPNFEQLSSGDYDLVIQDVNGCEWQSTVNIPNATALLLSFDQNPPIYFITLGDSVEVYLNSTIPQSQLASVTWLPSGTANNCQNCLSNTFQPFVTTTYSIFITTEKGCTTETDFTIFVDNNRPVFVPNAFSPNGDGVNDVLILFGGSQITQVRQFTILDRWGQTMYEAQNFPPNDIGNAWNGEFRGEKLNSGVFVWYAEIEFVDGKIEGFKGDITLIK